MRLRSLRPPAATVGGDTIDVAAALLLESVLDVASPPMPVPVCVVPRVSLLLKPTGWINSTSDPGGEKLM
jgi:hypothetical protein